MNKTAKAAIIIAIVALIALMWFLKNGFGTEEATAESAPVTAPAEPETGASQTDAEAGNIENATEGSGAQDKAEAEVKERMPMTQTAFDMEKWLEPGLPLLVDFGSKTCGPCQKMKPDLIKFHEEMEGKMTVVYLDVWEDPSRTGGLPANVVPTQYFFYPDGTPYMPSEDVWKNYYGFQQYTVKGSDEVVLTSHQGILFIDGLRAVAEDMGVTL